MLHGAAQVLRGAAIIKEVGANKPEVADLGRALKETLGTDPYLDPKQTDAVLTAAMAYYAASRGRANTLFDATDRNGLKTAIETVGGQTVIRNGVRFPAPPGVPASVVTGALDHLNQSTLNDIGGAIDRRGQPFTPEALSKVAIFKPLAAFGTAYAVGVADPSSPDGFALVRNRVGEPLIVDFEKIAALEAPFIRQAEEDKQRSFDDFMKAIGPAFKSVRP